jgi:MoxR-like ATPase
MKTKIQSLLQQLNQGLVEREHVLKLAMLTALAGENLVLVGPPGTGKSLVARRIANSLSHEGEGGGYFEYLLTKFSTPEELFGPLSIAALKNDRFHRNTEGYLPAVRMAFLDEIFKASSSILNALLTVLNERVYHNGTDVQKVPLQALIAASNELPTDQEELAALYDRFLVRVFVDYVGANNLPRLFETTTEPTLRSQDRLSAADLARVRQAAEQVVFEPALIQAVQDIWAAHKEAFKEDRRESLSDRRLKKVIHLMRVSAATNGREAVDLSDLMLLKDCLWNHADNVGKVQALVIKTLQRHSRQVPVSDQSHAPAYELGADGRTLVLTKLATTLAVAKVTTPAHAPRRSGAVVKGYMGSGTADDPLLIQSVDDLVDLARPEVGQQGYHFRQTADFDIRSISTWPEIDFKGHYNGNGKTISDAKHPNLFAFGMFDASEGKETRWIFRSTTESCITGLQTRNRGVAASAKNGSKFISCKTSTSLLRRAENCEIVSCEASDRLLNECATACKIYFCIVGEFISKTLDRCEVRSCQSGGSLVYGEAKATKFFDCLIINNNIHSSGGVANEIFNSTVECCFSTGSIKSRGWSGIVSKANASSVSRCALGRLNSENTPSGRIAFSTENNSKLDRNVSIDSVATTRFFDGESIAAARFNQRYFEHTLDWDFDKTWVWDNKNDRPALRQVGIGATPAAISAAANAPAASEKKPSVDLLTQQVKANMWL